MKKKNTMKFKTFTISGKSFTIYTNLARNSIGAAFILCLISFLIAYRNSFLSDTQIAVFFPLTFVILSCSFYCSEFLFEYPRKWRQDVSYYSASENKKPCTHGGEPTDANHSPHIPKDQYKSGNEKNTIGLHIKMNIGEGVPPFDNYHH